MKLRSLMRGWGKAVVYCGLPLPSVLKPAISGMYRVGIGIAEFGSLLRKVFWVEPILRSICERVGTGFRAERLPYIRGRGHLVLGDRVYLSGSSCFYFMEIGNGAAAIEIGDGVFIGHGCTLSCAAGIRVGAGSLISAGARIHDNDGHPVDAGRRRRGEPIVGDECRPVVIGRNVWLGACAIVLKGVTIGDDAVVGAGAVVARDVAPGTVVAGNPCRVIRLACDGYEQGGLGDS